MQQDERQQQQQQPQGSRQDAPAARYTWLRTSLQLALGRLAEQAAPQLAQVRAARVYVRACAGMCCVRACALPATRARVFVQG